MARGPGPEGVLHAGLQAAALTSNPTEIHLNQTPSEVLPVCRRGFITCMPKLGFFLGELAQTQA